MAIFRTVAFHHHVTKEVPPAHPDDAAFVASAEPVLALYSAALPALRLSIPRSCLALWIGMDPDDIGRITAADAPAEVQVGQLERVEGDNWAKVRVPPGTADLTLLARALLALDVVTTATIELAAMAGWAPDALDAVRQHVIDHGLGIEPPPANIDLAEPRPAVVLTRPDPFRIAPGGGVMDAPVYTRLSQALHQVMEACRSPEWREWWAAAQLGVLHMEYKIGWTDKERFVVRLARGTLTGRWECPAAFGRRTDLDHAAVAHAAWTRLMAKVQARAGLGPHPPIPPITIDEAAIARRKQHLAETYALSADPETYLRSQGLL